MTTSKFYSKTTKALAVMAVVGMATLMLGVGTIFMLMAAWALKHMWIAILA